MLGSQVSRMVGIPDAIVLRDALTPLGRYVSGSAENHRDMADARDSIISTTSLRPAIWVSGESADLEHSSE